MRARKLGVAAVATLAFGAMIATAEGGGQAKTSFIDTGVSCGIDLPDDKCLYSGVIDSESKKCIGGRKVKMYALLDQGGEIENKLVDTGITSKKGAFGGFGRPSDVSAAKFKALESKVGGTTCKAKSFTGV